MPNILNETEDEVEYDMQDDVVDPDPDRLTIVSATLAAGGTLYINEGLLEAKAVRHRFRSRETGEPMGPDIEAPIGKDITLKPGGHSA